MRPRRLASLLVVLSTLSLAGCDAGDPGDAGSGDGKADGLGDAAAPPIAIPVFLQPGEAFTTALFSTGTSTVWLQQSAAGPSVKARLGVNGAVREGSRPILDSAEQAPQLTIEVTNLGTTPLDGALMVAQFDPAMLVRLECTQCHALDRKLVGPSFREIARVYAKILSAEDTLEKRIRLGTSGTWSFVPMPALPKPTEAERRAMVRYILGLE